MVVWDSVGPLAATPPALTFGALSTDASPKRLKVVVKSTKGQSFRLTAWDGGDAAVQVEPGSDSSLPKPSHDAELIFDPSRSNGRHMLAGTATFTTDLDGAGVCSVRWSAFPRENTKSVSK
jgi:hypothetical protein